MFTSKPLHFFKAISPNWYNEKQKKLVFEGEASGTRLTVSMISIILILHIYYAVPLLK